jgi:DNA replication and repair protein RecF
LQIFRLELNNFRNYERQSLDLSPRRNVICGRNAQGKTNLLEAIYLLSHMSTPRTPRLSDVIREGEKECSIKGGVADDETGFNVRLIVESKSRTVELNGREIKPASRAKGLVKCVLFSPEDLYLVKGAADRRRKFLDETAEGVEPGLADRAGRFEHVLRQRNAIVREWELHGRRLEPMLVPWSEAMVEAGAHLVAFRRRAVMEMVPLVERAYERVSGSAAELQIEYAGSFEGDSTNVEIVKEEMKKALEESTKEERRARCTVVGPHRDDLDIRLGGREARYMASQGEQRTLSFCLRVAQKSLIQERSGKEPIMLLDDVLSELDGQRRQSVMEMVGEGSQSIITTAEKPHALEPGAEAVFLVRSGSVSVVST